MAGGSIILWSSFGLARNHWSTRDTVERMGPLIPDT